MQGGNRSNNYCSCHIEPRLYPLKLAIRGAYIYWNNPLRLGMGTVNLFKVFKQSPYCIFSLLQQDFV